MAATPLIFLLCRHISSASVVEITSPLEDVTTPRDGVLVFSALVRPVVPNGMIRFSIGGSVHLGQLTVEEQKDFSLSPCHPPCHTKVHLKAIQMRLGIRSFTATCCHVTAVLEVNGTAVSDSSSASIFYDIAPHIRGVQPLLHLPLRNGSREWSEEIATDDLAVVIMDPWNWHWCKTAERRMDALIERINVAIERSAGADLFSQASRSMPTANAEGLCRSEGTQQGVSSKLF